MLSVIRLNVIMQGDIKLSVIMVNVVMPIVIMLSITVPYLAAVIRDKDRKLNNTDLSSIPITEFSCLDGRGGGPRDAGFYADRETKCQVGRNPRGLYYKTFYDRNLWIFVIS